MSFNYTKYKALERIARESSHAGERNAARSALEKMGPPPKDEVKQTIRNNWSNSSTATFTMTDFEDMLKTFRERAKTKDSSSYSPIFKMWDIYWKT